MTKSLDKVMVLSEPAYCMENGEVCYNTNLLYFYNMFKECAYAEYVVGETENYLYIPYIKQNGQIYLFRDKIQQPVNLDVFKIAMSLNIIFKPIQSDMKVINSYVQSCGKKW